MPSAIKAYCLEKRIPRSQLQLGEAYIINARNGAVGIWTHDPEHPTPEHRYGFKLRRTKWGSVFLDREFDWADCTSNGTAIPLHHLGSAPELGGQELLDWLELKTEETRPWMQEFWAGFRNE